jgi:hypothetical protein
MAQYNTYTTNIANIIYTISYIYIHIYTRQFIHSHTPKLLRGNCAMNIAFNYN